MRRQQPGRPWRAGLRKLLPAGRPQHGARVKDTSPVSRTEADSSDPLTTASAHPAAPPHPATSLRRGRWDQGPRRPRGRELSSARRPPPAVRPRRPGGHAAPRPLRPPRAGAPTPRPPAAPSRLPPAAPAEAGGTLEGTHRTQDAPRQPAAPPAVREDSAGRSDGTRSPGGAGGGQPGALGVAQHATHIKREQPQRCRSGRKVTLEQTFWEGSGASRGL